MEILIAFGGVILGFILQLIAQVISNKRKNELAKYNNNALSKEFVRLYLMDEIQENHTNFAEKKIGEGKTRLDYILSGAKNYGEGNDGSIKNFYLNYEEWTLSKKAIVELDQNTALKVNALYRYYIYLCNHYKYADELLHLDNLDFKNYMTIYKELINYINS